VSHAHTITLRVQVAPLCDALGKVMIKDLDLVSV
jgi:hypothetical protein